MRITNLDTLSAMLDRLVTENIKKFFFEKDGLDKIVSLYQFNQRRYTTFENLDLKKVENLNYDAFMPEGSTALNDAIGFTIERTNHITKNKDYNIIFVILTDGEENSSRNYDSHDIEKSILNIIKL